MEKWVRHTVMEAISVSGVSLELWAVSTLWSAAGRLLPAAGRLAFAAWRLLEVGVCVVMVVCISLVKQGRVLSGMCNIVSSWHESRAFRVDECYFQDGALRL